VAVEVALGGAAYAGILLTFYRPLVMRYVQFVLGMRRNRDAWSAAAI